MAETVVRRSSVSRTGTRHRSAPPGPRRSPGAARAAGPSPPGQRAGSPTTTSTTSCSSTSAASGPGRCRPTGSRVEGSQRRREHPDGIGQRDARRAPRRRRRRSQRPAAAPTGPPVSPARPRSAARRAGDGRRRPRPASVPPPWARSGLPPPRPPTAGRERLTSSPAASPRSRARRGGGHHEGDLARRVGANSATTPGPRPEPARGRRRPARAGRRRRRPRAVRPRDQRGPADVLGAVGERARRGEHRGGADLLQLLLRGAQPLDDCADALGQLLGPGLELLGELGDQHVLAGQEAERVDADQRLDPAHARRRWSASPSSLTRPSWPERWTWVPPHSSRE